MYLHMNKKIEKKKGMNKSLIFEYFIFYMVDSKYVIYMQYAMIYILFHAPNL